MKQEQLLKGYYGSIYYKEFKEDICSICKNEECNNGQPTEEQAKDCLREW